MTDSLSQKLPDQELRQLLDEGTNEKVSVIVELDLPPQSIHFDSHGQNSQSPGFYAAKHVVEESPAQQKKNEQTIKRTRKFLEELSGTTPRWLNSARAFVVTLTPKQLQQLAQFPLTKTIRLNRHLQKTG